MDGNAYKTEKINKIRWKPEINEEPQHILTGNNKIVLWQLVKDAPKLFKIREYPYCGAVTEIKFLNTELFASSSSSGSAHIMGFSGSGIAGPLIQDYVTWKHIHYFKNGNPSPCTALAVHDPSPFTAVAANNFDVATVGEDGRINILTAESTAVVRTIDNADTCAIKCVTYVTRDQILTSNQLGVMKSWDQRSDTNQPISIFMNRRAAVVSQITHLTCHPTQRYIMVAGDEWGIMTSWDLRQNKHPVNILSAHKGAISAIHFDQERADHLFSCSQDGKILHWSPKTKTQFMVGDNTNNPWLLPEQHVNDKLKVTSFGYPTQTPFNCMDISGNRIVCGCDSTGGKHMEGIRFYQPTLKYLPLLSLSNNSKDLRML
ncbi:unnamed protein product [Ceutorhynchus assimilis]|uniref:Uncharacterized protein n=1 Tax=Ceutorhynchus assimilis TaxID=467358 RepID=A0A9N9MAW6_9CUCU|nr:unnamed protein product [Ceutorhynchus assimilis]